MTTIYSHPAEWITENEPPTVAAARGVMMSDPGSEPSRTDLAEDRTILANERTFAGWMRTSLACLAIGVGSQALFQKMEPSWLPRAIATAFLVMAILVIILAERRASAVMRRLSAHVVVTARPLNLRLFTTVIALGATALAVGIWVIDLG